jgi:hypothetical protein
LYYRIEGFCTAPSLCAQLGLQVFVTSAEAV